MKEPKRLPTLIHHCMTIGAIPSSYKLSLSYEEQLMWFCHFLESEVIPVVNNNSAVVQELKNWFENLDVQDEIDNKLEEMAESGELTEIIAQYLDLQGILAYNTLSDLAAAENLANGSFTKIYGKVTYNDGYGAFYKIRQLLNTDVIDGDILVALTNYPTLVAEKMSDAEITSLNNKIGNLANLTTESKTNSVAAINEINAKLNDIEITPNKPFGMKKAIIIGDSYASRTDNWVNTLVNKLGLSSSEYYKSAKGSTGFVSESEGKTFLTLLTDVTNELTTSEKAEITHVIVCGGANDNTYTESQIDTAIGIFVTTVNSTLPNAKTFIGEIGWTSITANIINYRKVVSAYSKCTKYNRCYYLNNVQYTLHNYNFLLSDNVHPTEDGNIALGSNIHQALMCGSCEIVYPQLLHKLDPNTTYKSIYESLNNNLAMVYNGRYSLFNGGGESVIADSSHALELTEDIFEYVKGSYYTQNRTFIMAHMVVDGTHEDIGCTIGVDSGKLCLYPLAITSGGAIRTLTNITSIIIPQFVITMDSLNC